jgi:hypothetical protein
MRFRLLLVWLPTLAGCPDFPEHLLLANDAQADGPTNTPDLRSNPVDQAPPLDNSPTPDTRPDSGPTPDVSPVPDVGLWADKSPSPDVNPWPDLVPAPDVVPWPDTAPSPLYVDNFTTSTGMVDDGQGNWTLQGGIFSQTTCNQAPDTVVPAKTWTDIKVSVRIRGEQVCGLGQGGPTVRVQANTGCNNYYYWCVVDFDNHRLIVGHLKGSCLGPGSSKTTPSLQLNIWYDLQFLIKGQTFSCQLSGGNLTAPITATRSDGVNPIPSGSAGLVTDGLKASFDDFVVEAN